MRDEIVPNPNTVKQLESLMDEIGLRQMEAAQMLDITNVHLNAVFRGRTNPSRKLLRRMAALRDRLEASGLTQTA